MPRLAFFLALALLAHAAPVPPRVGHPTSSSPVSYSPDGRYVAAFGAVTDLKADTATELGAERLAFTGDGRRLYGMFRDHTLKCWDVPGLKERFAVKARQSLDFENLAGIHQPGLAVSPDGKYVATFRTSRALAVWDGATGKPVRTLTCRSTVWSVAISPDGSLIAAGEEKRRVTLWDLSTGKLVESYEATPPRDHPDDVGDGLVNNLCFSPNGKYLAAGVSRIGGSRQPAWVIELAVRDLAAKKARFVIDVSENWMHALAYRPDGQQIATSGYGGVKYVRRTNGCVKFWSATSGAAEGERAVTDKEYVRGVAYHPDGRRVAVYHVGLKFWDAPRR